MKFIPDNYDAFVFYELEQERLNRIHSIEENEEEGEIYGEEDGIINGVNYINR